jgi:hypothetical protein
VVPRFRAVTSNGATVCELHNRALACKNDHSGPRTLRTPALPLERGGL